MKGGDDGGSQVVFIGKSSLAGSPGGEEAVGIKLRGALCVCTCMFGHDLRNKRENAGSMISSAKTQPYHIIDIREVQSTTSRSCPTFN